LSTSSPPTQENLAAGALVSASTEGPVPERQCAPKNSVAAMQTSLLLLIFRDCGSDFLFWTSGQRLSLNDSASQVLRKRRLICKQAANAASCAGRFGSNVRVPHVVHVTHLRRRPTGTHDLNDSIERHPFISSDSDRPTTGSELFQPLRQAVQFNSLAI